MDATSAMPALHADVSVDAPIGQTRVVHNAATRKYFRLGLREAAFLESLDGRADEAALAAANVSGFNPAEVAHLLAWFAQQGLLAGTAVVEPAAKGWRARLKRFTSGPDALRIHLFDPNAFLDRHIGVVHAFFSRPALAAYLFIFLLPVLAFIFAPEALRASASSYTDQFPAWQWAGLYASILAVIGVHEMAHAVACKHYGGKVHKIGIMLMYLQPVMYCDISDSWRMGDVQKKVVIAAAGIFAQMLISCLVITVWMVDGAPILLYFAVMNAGVALLNFFPLVKLDGYWMLVHVLDEPNLRKKSLQAFGNLLRRGSRGQFPAALVAFGAGSVLGALLFWAAGFYTVHKYASRVSGELAIGLTIVLACLLAWRAWAFKQNFFATSH